MNHIKFTQAFGHSITALFIGVVLASCGVGGGTGVTVPLPPTGVIATAGDGQVTIRWNAALGATSYKLYMNTLPGIVKTTLTNMHHPSVSSPFVHSTLINDTTYYFVVTAVNANGESIESSEVSATPQAPFSSVADGTNPNGCVRDNVTGLMWEVKTNDAIPGLRDWTKIYTNFDSTLSAQKYDSATNVFSTPTQAEINAPSNSIGFKNAVNATNLCGFNDWRLPTVGELRSIVKLGSFPAINSTWFPNTQAHFFWSASPYVGSSDNAWGIDFNDGYVGVINGRYSNVYVRLVRTSP